MGTTINSNGGGRVLTLEALFDRLAAHPLDRGFEAYGNFVIREPKNQHGDPLGPPDMVRFFGNFFTYSHVFSIDTDDADLVERLTAAIRANQRRDDYLAQDAPPPVLAVGWRNPVNGEAGEYLSRDRADAERFAKIKRKQGCETEIVQPLA